MPSRPLLALLLGATACAAPQQGVRVTGDAPLAAEVEIPVEVAGELSAPSPAPAGEIRVIEREAERPIETVVVDGVTLPASVAVIGDSLTQSAEDEIETALTGLGLRVVAIDGLESRRMTRGGSERPPGTDAIDEIVGSDDLPDVWIVALGTNDVGSQVGSGFGDDVAAVVRRIPPGAPLLWVDLWIRDRPDAIADANDSIRSVLAVRTNSAVIDWYARASAPGVITRDGVHLTDSGQELFAFVMADAVSRVTIE